MHPSRFIHLCFSCSSPWPGYSKNMAAQPGVLSKLLTKSFPSKMYISLVSKIQQGNNSAHKCTPANAIAGGKQQKHQGACFKPSVYFPTHTCSKNTLGKPLNSQNRTARVLQRSYNVILCLSFESLDLCYPRLSKGPCNEVRMVRQIVHLGWKSLNSDAWMFVRSIPAQSNITKIVKLNKEHKRTHVFRGDGLWWLYCNQWRLPALNFHTFNLSLV